LSEAIASLDKYLGNHPNGNYLLNAHYYKADCHLKLNQLNEALSSLDYIAAQPRNMFSELALVASSGIHYSITGITTMAVNQYLRLLEIASDPANIRDARIGVMRCYYQLEEHSNTITAATEVLNMEKIS
jgi:tetratricopeptide (TPR) repeat protein